MLRHNTRLKSTQKVASNLRNFVYVRVLGYVGYHSKIRAYNWTF